MSKEKLELKRIDENRWEIPRAGGMRVPGIIYASERLMHDIGTDESPRQVANVAHLPGIVNYSLAMPDMHWGYGFPIGGVAAFDLQEGVVSPGGVGYDINCGCRLMTTKLTLDDISRNLKELVVALFQNIPSGVGSKGDLKLSLQDEKKVLQQGAGWAVEHGYGLPEDLEATEDGGMIKDADPEKVSVRALERGKAQLGTLGSGNHFLEIEVVDEIFDADVAAAFGLEKGQVAVMIHSGSRGLGYQICDDYLAEMVRHIGELDFALPDRQLACAYLNSKHGRDYLAAMACAANYAWANRQMLMHRTREIFARTLRKSPREIGMRLLYDVCHNIAKIEKFPLAGREVALCVHRKGATRAFPPGHPALPERYRSVGQPVLIPGDMGSGSYVLVGTEKAFQETFGSACHGAGRVMSRSKATKASKGRSIAREMADQGVIVMASGRGTLREELPEAYKNLDDVVEVVHRAGISRKVARLKTIGCIKG
ncbi:MAG: RNA-splicing ligase RtcB [Syntrophobacteraceae bacterium CG23_combo_of_CG06-09_8_20_14_all_50_8]|nr:MAG: RNA-splicing ligase RtcB [Syntrophobacteraceae bacterium CG23_combo_of_CG06-09_8_20_14_all_50_8]